MLVNVSHPEEMPKTILLLLPACVTKHTCALESLSLKIPNLLCLWDTVCLGWFQHCQILVWTQQLCWEGGSRSASKQTLSGYRRDLKSFRLVVLPLKPVSMSTAHISTIHANILFDVKVSLWQMRPWYQHYIAPGEWLNRMPAPSRLTVLKSSVYSWNWCYIFL